MQIVIVKALVDTRGPDLSGNLVQMAANTLHIASQKDAGYFIAHADAFEIVEQAPTAALATFGKTNGVITGLLDEAGNRAPVPVWNSEGTALLGADGMVMPIGQTVMQRAGLLDIMPVDATTLWTTDKTAALTVAVDSSVLFQGRPTLKITIPAGTSGVCKVGCSGASALLPYLWDRNDLGMAVMYSGFTGYDLSSTFPPPLVGYIGDASYTNFWTINGFNGANYPESKMRQDEWCVLKPAAAGWSVGAGSPSTALGNGTEITSQTCRSKWQWTQVSQATDCYIWIGFFGRLPPRAKPTIVLSLDDGYASWYSFIAPVCKHYDLPVSLAIDSALVGDANYMTEAQIQELFADSSRLFDIINHGVNNQSYNTLGAADYFDTVEATREYLQSIGIYGDGPLHHPYVQSVWGNDLVDLLDAGGYLSARASTTVAMHGRDQVITDDKARWHLNIVAALGSAKSLSDVNTAVDAVVTNNIVGFINGHDFGASADTYKWAYADMQQLLGRIASLRDAGTLEVKSWSRWYADLTGRPCDRK